MPSSWPPCRPSPTPLVRYSRVTGDAEELTHAAGQVPEEEQRALAEVEAALHSGLPQVCSCVGFGPTARWWVVMMIW